MPRKVQLSMCLITPPLKSMLHAFLSSALCSCEYSPCWFSCFMSGMNLIGSWVGFIHCLDTVVKIVPASARNQIPAVQPMTSVFTD